MWETPIVEWIDGVSKNASFTLTIFNLKEDNFDGLSGWTFCFLIACNFSKTILYWSFGREKKRVIFYFFVFLFGGRGVLCWWWLISSCSAYFIICLTKLYLFLIRDNFWWYSPFLWGGLSREAKVIDSHTRISGSDFDTLLIVKMMALTCTS